MSNVWMPIESAPRDGRDVLLASSSGGGVVIGFWIDSQKAGWEGWMVDGEGRNDGSYSHWAPLPRHPAAALEVGDS